MIYEYACTKCSHKIEKFQTVRIAMVLSCAVCGRAMERIISKSNFKLVGAGFHVNDYPKEEKKNE